MSIFLLFIIAISLSMDSFSLALSLGSFNVPKKMAFYFSIIVGIFHFFMPILGYLLSNYINYFLNINYNKILFIVFIFISIEMFFDIFNKDNKNIDLTFVNMLIYAFSVSIDSLSLGIGLKSIFPASIIFSIVSFMFTYIGFFIGKKSYDKLGKKSKIIGLILILLVAFLHLFN